VKGFWFTCYWYAVVWPLRGSRVADWVTDGGSTEGKWAVRVDEELQISWWFTNWQPYREVDCTGWRTASSLDWRSELSAVQALLLLCTEYWDDYTAR